MSFNANSAASNPSSNAESSRDTSTSINFPHSAEPGAVAGSASSEMNTSSRNFIDVNRILQSNSFLRSDLGDFANIQQSLPGFANPGLAPQNQGQAATVVYPNRNATHVQNRAHVNMANDPEAGVDVGGQAPPQTFVLNFGNQGGQQQQAQAEQGGEPAPPNFFADALGAMTSSLPFILIFIAKIFHQHLLGFIIVLGFLVTLHWSNRFLVNQVELKVSTLFIDLVSCIFGFIFAVCWIIKGTEEHGQARFVDSVSGAQYHGLLLHLQRLQASKLVSISAFRCLTYLD